MILHSFSQLRTLSKKLHRKGARIVWTNGCFDLLHYGHLINFQKAKAMGDVLIVGINGDRSSYFRHKPGRPLQPEKIRAALVEALKPVDHVFIYQDETPLRAIETVRPKVLAKGADYKTSEIVGQEVVKKNGGVIRRIPLVRGHSTSQLVRTILERYESS